MVVVFLWFCLYVPCTGYTVFICRERIYGVRSEINFIFTKARGCSRALHLHASCDNLSKDNERFVPLITSTGWMYNQAGRSCF